MKKPHFSILVAVTLLFCGFLLGFLYGRIHERGDVIVSVPSQMLTEPAPTVMNTESSSPTEAAIVFPIDINTADKRALMELPGIGEVLAERILAYRKSHDAFGHVTDLMKVEGIGQTRMEEILEYVTTGG